MAFPGHEPSLGALAQTKPRPRGWGSAKEEFVGLALIKIQSVTL
jgi:hypothetical protein